MTVKRAVEAKDPIFSKPKAFLTSQDLAQLCDVDPKTIHNWVNSGQIRYWRTPGRHLRFSAPQVVTFMEHYGFPVPDALRSLAALTETEQAK